MEFEIRSVLLVVGLVVIAAILIHGLMSIRKANKPVDLSGIDFRDEDEQGALLRDSSGFDRHGVGVARKINSEDELEDDLLEDNNAAAIMTSVASDQENQLDLDLPELPTFDNNADSIDFDVALTTPELQQSIIEDKLTIEQPQAPVFDSPIFREKPPTPPVLPTAAPDVEVVAQASSQPSVSDDAPMAAKPAPEVQETMDVLVLNVIASDGDELNGAELLPILLTLGFKFGEMNIFHRHVSSAGHGEVLFSLANMVKPGIFEIDNMEQFTTTGVSLFMTLPQANGNLETFNLMLNAAAKIAEEFSGQVLDGNRSTLTNQLTQHYVERIREVERKLLLKKK